MLAQIVFLVMLSVAANVPVYFMLRSPRFRWSLGRTPKAVSGAETWDSHSWVGMV